MLQVTKEEPEFFISKKKKISLPNQSTSWEEISDIRSDLRKYILEKLIPAQCVCIQPRRYFCEVCQPLSRVGFRWVLELVIYFLP